MRTTTEVTWDPVTGCDRISPGCDRCDALTLARRLKAIGQACYQNDGRPPTSGPELVVTVHENALEAPLRWQLPRRVFVNSMSDLFHARVPASFIARVFAVMAVSPQHTFQVLTERPIRPSVMLSDDSFRDNLLRPAVDKLIAHRPLLARAFGGQPLPWPLPNVWLGTSIENDACTWRADALRRAPAAVCFLSCEPLLGPLPSLDLTGIGWVIAGGESGPGHRPLEPDWVRDLRDRCLQLGIPFFFKQHGGHTPKAGGRELDGRTWDQYPEEKP